VASTPASAAQVQVRAQAKLQAARARLILDRPFVGALLLHLPAVASTRCATLGTDGRTIHFDPGYIDRLTLRQTQFMLAHQAMHCALGHFARRGHRTRNRWDIACDFAVNQLLVDDGLEAPPGALVDVRYRGLSAEEIYPSIAPGADRTTLDVHLFDHATDGAAGQGVAAPSADRARRERTREADAGAFSSDDEAWSDAAPHGRRNEGATSPPPPGDPEALARQWQLRLATAAQQAQRAGKLGASWHRALGRLLQPTLPWHALLARHVVSRAHHDYSFQKPSRREGAAILPRLDSTQLELFVVLDVSGSVSEAQLAAFAAELEAIKGQVRARITLHACDEQLAPEGPWIFEAWEPVTLPPTLRGGASTDFRPAFDWVREAMHRPDLLIYFTDGEGEFPPLAPPYPVIWLVKGPAPVPWGERIQLN
jgi:predicted metal-dependent peptidase